VTTFEPSPDPAEMAFRFRSGRLCLNFCATVGERWRGRYGRLPASLDLARWYVEADLIAKTLRLDEADLERARIVREAIYRGATALTTAGRPRRADETIINSAAEPAPLVPQLRAAKVRWSLPAESAGPALLSTVARDAIELFSGPYAGRIRACASSECGILFLDSSRPGHRRWCSSAACGGRDRASSYRRRHRPGLPETTAGASLANPE
jgi:predicted RNA-binding Zn ribbon-like protein